MWHGPEPVAGRRGVRLRRRRVAGNTRRRTAGPVVHGRAVAGNLSTDILEFLGPDAPQTQPEDARLIATTHRLSGHQLLLPHRSYGRRPFFPTVMGRPLLTMGWEVARSV